MESVEADGGDPEAVDFVEVNFPDMQPQMEMDNVEASPETVEKYQAVMDFMEVSEEVAETTLFLDEYDSTIRTEQLTELADLMVKYEFIAAAAG